MTLWMHDRFGDYFYHDVTSYRFYKNPDATLKSDAYMVEIVLADGDKIIEPKRNFKAAREE